MIHTASIFFVYTQIRVYTYRDMCIHVFDMCIHEQDSCIHQNTICVYTKFRVYTPKHHLCIHICLVYTQE
jgi:hypothetical protein